MAFAGASVVIKLFGGPDFTFVPAFWSIGIAMGYAKLWQAGFDWRDVFKQPRETLLADVVSEKAEDFAALWDPNKRNTVRERARLRRQSGSGDMLFSDTDRMLTNGGVMPVGAAPGTPANDQVRFGAWYDAVRDGTSDRAEIQRMFESLPKSEKSMASGIVGNADELLAAVKSEAAQLADLDRNPVQAADVTRIEAEIAQLESQANPLDTRSEERVRRLVRLRREGQQAKAESGRRRHSAERLEKARAALRSIRVELVKLRSGGAQPGYTGNVTQLAERAQELARDVDAVIAAVGSAKSRASSSGSR
jgi:hypothetical protein